MPTWVSLLVAAETLGVAPWELAEQPPFWGRCAITLATARRQVEKSDLRRAEIEEQARRMAGTAGQDVQVIDGDDIDALRVHGVVKE